MLVRLEQSAVLAGHGQGRPVQRIRPEGVGGLLFERGSWLGEEVPQ
ncbi:MULTISPECIES: hypothetical protein [unclassified Kitasatospora]